MGLTRARRDAAMKMLRRWQVTGQAPGGHWMGGLLLVAYAILLNVWNPSPKWQIVLLALESCDCPAGIAQKRLEATRGMHVAAGSSFDFTRDDAWVLYVAAEQGAESPMWLGIEVLSPLELWDPGAALAVYPLYSRPTIQEGKRKWLLDLDALTVQPM